MPAIPATTTRFSWFYRKNYGFFTPNGKLTATRGGRDRLTPNRVLWSSTDPMYAARLFVGFNVGATPTWKMQDAIDIVRRIRSRQVGVADSTFLYQRGIYTHQSSGETVEEDGAQIIVLNLPEFGATKAEFVRQVTELAEELAEALKQEQVIVEIQQGGLSKETFSVGGLEEE